METPFIIALSGKKGSGKDEFCKVAIDLWGDKVARLAFADPLKHEAAQHLAGLSFTEITQSNPGVASKLWADVCNGFAHLYAKGQSDETEVVYTYAQLRAMFDDPDVKPAFRLLLQVWGTEYRRENYSDVYWLNKMTEAFDEALANGVRLVLITDCRFPNEFSYLFTMGAEMVRVERPGNEGTENSTHPSETALDDEERWDAIILNEGTLEDFHLTVRAYLTGPERGLGIPGLVDEESA